MDSYDIFGEDGSGMLEGLADLTGTDNFSDGSSPAVSGQPPREPERRYQQTYGQGPSQQEGTLQKLGSFGAGSGGAPVAPSSGTPSASGGEYADYGAYPPRPRLPHPPHPSHHPPHHPHPSLPYSAYHTASDPLYAMPEHPGVGDMGGWPGAPGPARGYPPQSYRHPYDQQKMHQYPPQQGSSLSMQGMGQGSYMQRQPHYAQPPSQQMYAQQQSYPGYNQMHPQNVSRISQHAPYHQQIDLNAHQYGHVVHGQQGRPGVPPHQSHQSIGGHQGAHPQQAGMQSHAPVHMHHPAPVPHGHHPSPACQPPSAPPTTAPPPAGQPPPPSAYAPPPHQPTHLTMPMGYQPHQLQRALDVNVGVANQYKPPGMEGSSPQYRAPFPQLSPQMSPRAQMSPRPPAPQMSPRPALSPAKPTSASPHGPRPPAPSPVPIPPSAAYSQQSTLQALEQMVMPSSSEYSYQRNPTSPALISRMPPSPQPWSQNIRINSLNGAMENNLLYDKLDQHHKQPDHVNMSSRSADNTKINTQIHPQEHDIASNSPGSNEQIVTTKEGLSSNETGDFFRQDNDIQMHVLKTVEKENFTCESVSTDKQVKTTSKVEIIADNETMPDEKTDSHVDFKGRTDCKDVIASGPSSDGNDSSHQTSHASSTEKTTSQGNSTAESDTSSNSTVLTSESVPTQNTGQTSMIIPIINSQHNVSQNSYENLQDSNTSGLNMPISSVQTVVQNDMSPSIPSSVPSKTLQTNIPTNVPPNTGANLQPNFLPNVPNIQRKTALAPQLNIPPTMLISGMPHTPNMQTQIIQQGSIQSGHTQPTNSQANLPGIPSPIPGHPLSVPNMPPSMPGPIPQNVPPGMPPNITGAMPPGIAVGMPPGMPSNCPPGMPPSLSHNIMMGVIPHPGIAGLYQGPISHLQERAALQQQLQEIYCMPPSPENQEKARRIQERLAILQQHEANDKCNGGPSCLLQNPIYGSTMVESPQVSSTTGRGRAKGPPKPRKSRAKKDKHIPTQPIQQLPVSEDCVTAGTGLQLTNAIPDLDVNGEMTILENNETSVEVDKNGKPKKPRTPRKPREPRKPRTPKEPKPPKEPKEKVPKERKKREPKDPNAPKRKRASKKDISEMQADTTTSEIISPLEGEPNASNVGVQVQSESNLHADSDSVSKSTIPKPIVTDDNTVTDFDDIPVSKIAIKDLLEEAEAKREREEKDMDSDTSFSSPVKKRSSSGRKRSGVSSRKSASRKSSGGRRKRKGGIVLESDGEPDDFVTTPPPSPSPEGDCDSSKRRSARHTQRKKYTDDVMLRLSDEEFTMKSTPRRENKEQNKDKKSSDNNDVQLDDNGDVIPKPNYMYINTTDEDSMVVQHVLACRIGKRELRPEILPPPKENLEINNEELKTKLESETTADDNENKDSEKIKIDSAIRDKDLPVDGSNEVNYANGQEEKFVGLSIKSDLPSEGDSDKDKQDKNDITPEVPSLENKTPANASEHEIETKTPVVVDIEEFYVKYRNFSYLHCEWKTEEELYKGDKRIQAKIKRFKQKQAQQLNIFELLDDEPFNPDYVEVERVLDVSEHTDPDTKKVVKHYLAKWKGLQYEDSTWELEEDIDTDKIRQFVLFNEIPPKEKWRFKRRPNPDQWEQLDESPLYKGGNTLRPYQLEGLNWLLFSWYNNRNCILADEMGLGKTIQSLTFVNAVWEYGIRGPFLIIAPLSTIPNWQREFEGWTDMNVIVYHGSQQSKSMIQEYEFYYKNENNSVNKDFTKFNVLITTFEMIVTDFQELKMFNWRLCVIDEAHRLKNRNCKLLEGLRQLHLDHRVLLSGTPLQNNVNELFSLLNFLEPSQFSSNDAFLSEFGQLKTESEVIKLQALLKPMMLRRLKEDVEKSLAPKEETIVEVELTNIQKKYYRGILERNFSFLSKGTASAANIPNLMNTMMELRKCCIHPYLLNGAEEQIQFDYKQTHGEDSEAYYKALIQSSGKMVLVDKLLPKLKAGGHRVLIFSQMVRCLDILEDYLMFKRYPFERIDGRIRGNLRQEAIDRFSKPDSDRFVFLLCTKAGGLGINLTAADTVIIYDSDWNPQNDLQAQARCHRIGQQKMVKIYRLICQNTYEREMFDKASVKLGLDKAVLQSMNTSQGGEKTGNKQLSKKEIEDLLKKGAYGAVMDEDNAGDKFCEEDIEMILARRTQVIQMASEKGSTFSKASFSANNQRCDIDIRDPDFWNKWAKKAEIDTTEKKEDEDLIVTEPRRRTIIKRYGHDDSNVEMSDMEVTPDTDEEEEGIGLRSKRKKEKFSKKGRKYNTDDYIPRHEGGVPTDEDVVYGNWARSECFKIERGLLTFGWARWEDILVKNQFRKGWTVAEIEDCARIIVLYCLRHYKGDEKIRNFIWDLIEPCENGEVTIARNHSGLHNPVPRGRNAKKKIKPKDVPKSNAPQKWEDPSHWSSADKYDCEAYLESSYKKHLFRHANKVLLRVRMMYYIKHEVIGEYAHQLETGVHASALGMRVPRAVDSAPPRAWWDAACDVSLLAGTYLHGYENYLAMRSDPQLCYVDKLGPPDDAECTNIKNDEGATRGGLGDEDATDDVSSGAGAATDASPTPSPRPDDDDAAAPPHQWPSMQDLNTRLRRLITSYQRNYKKEELKMQQRAKKLERRERMEQLAREEAAQWRWSHADEEAFRRTVASYGVEFDPATKSLRWGRFRALARLDSKSDDALTDYLKAFMAMCKRQCGLAVGEAELPSRADLRADPISEERAIATLERIDLLRVLREEVAPHVALDARLSLCEPAPDAPPWWQPARHDKLLVLGVCKHGLGDTYNKLFCDPKLPFADCARKYTETRQLRPRRESRKPSTDDDADSDGGASAPRRSGRRADADADAMSELESLARLARAEPAPPAAHWFSERALETRLHHIAHAVQNGEWPAAPRAPDVDEQARARKQHIAIDVETERAKLHALLTGPPPRDDASSDSGSRRSTPAPHGPAPPPAHQRVPTPAPSVSGAVDLSAPLDLSEPPDTTVRRSPPPPPPAHATSSVSTAPVAGKGKLDDTLSKLLKRKNVPEPEVIVGKEKKRRKLDEIVLGLSAAKAQSPSAATIEPARSKNPPVLPNVTVMPAAPPRSSPAPAPNQKPFSVTVTSVPSPHAPKEPPKELSSFLQQSLEQAGLLKPHKPNPAALHKSYSHEAKVNKWLAEQAAAAGLEERRRRQFAPRFSGDDYVPVVHRVTGKRLSGPKAPQLKHLQQWISENPMYDIDPKWSDSMKDYKTPQDARTQRPSALTSVGSTERKKGRPPSLDAATGASFPNLAGLNPSLLAGLSGLGAFDSKTLAATLSNLTGFDAKTLSSFDPKLLASLSNFDPKNNPLLMPFNSMPNMLGNMTGGNMFANLAGLGLPGFSGVDMAGLGIPTSSADGSGGKGKGRKSSESASSSGKSSTGLTSSSSSQFQFMFPGVNPSLLYPQLGIGSLNPFGMQSGLSAYDTLAQCGLLNGSLSGSSATTTAHSTSHSVSRSSSSKVTPARSTPVASTSTVTSRQHKSALDRQQAQLQQLLLPPDTYLLDSLTKHVSSYEAALKADKRSRESERKDVAADLSKADKRKQMVDSFRNYPPEFAAVQERLMKSSKGDKKDVDISKMLFEQMASGALSASLVSSAQHSKRAKDTESKDAFEKLSKSSAEYIARSLSVDETSVAAGQKRSLDDAGEPENLVMHSGNHTSTKKHKESGDDAHQDPVPKLASPPPPPPPPPPPVPSADTRDPQNTGEMDLEDLIAPSTVIKSGAKPRTEVPEQSRSPEAPPVQQPIRIPASLQSDSPSVPHDETTTPDGSEQSRQEVEGHSDGSEREEKTEEGKESGNENAASAEEVSDGSEETRKGKKRGRRPTEESAAAGVRRELRSSAGRQAAAAAARHAAGLM